VSKTYNSIRLLISVKTDTGNETFLYYMHTKW